MNHPRHQVVIIVVLALLLPVSFYAGSLAGFSKGAEVGHFLSGNPVTGMVFSLNQLRQGKTPEAINNLEGELDCFLSETNAERENFESWLNPYHVQYGWSLTDLDRQAFLALHYREKFSSSYALFPMCKAGAEATLARLSVIGSQRQPIHQPN